jgi:beta-1,4-mannosyltransferase
MLAHALAAAEQGAIVDLVGYAGTPLPSCVAAHPRIEVHTIATGDATLYIGAAIGRAAWRAARLIVAAMRCPPPDIVLVQTPPAIPGVLAARVVAGLRRSRLVIDWHCFSDAVLARRLGIDAPGVRWLRTAELLLARGADAHLAVSGDLADVLRLRDRSFDASVVPDAPIERVPRLQPAERARLFDRLAADGVLTSCEAASIAAATTALLVAPTSWNGDDDFDALIEALTHYDAAGALCPPVLVLITGVGALRARFEATLRTREWQRVSVKTAWVAADDYPRLLAAADLGLSLHATLAGVDPPIKLTDMRGAGLPSCVLGPDGAKAFANELITVLDGFPRSTALESARADLVSAPLPTWLESWPLTVAPRLAVDAARLRESLS